MHSLDGKAALLMGATSGIGLAVARNFVASGAQVIITGRRAEGDDLAKKIGASFLRCDATVEAEVAGCLEAAEQLLGKLDVLLVNAGCADDEGSIEEFAATGMDAIVDLNLNMPRNTLKTAPQLSTPVPWQVPDSRTPAPESTPPAKPEAPIWRAPVR